jgi:HPt (histidine-containing phosphotransfer) domain-containing protein
MNDAEAMVVHIDPDLEDLIPEFLDNRRGDIKSIHAALANHDYETIRVLGHGMKGAGGGYGFDDITVIGAALEQAAKQRDGAAIRAGLDQLALYLGKVKVVYDEL